MARFQTGELETLREQIFGVTVSRMAELLGIPRPTYKKYENGTFAVPEDIAKKIMSLAKEAEGDGNSSVKPDAPPAEPEAKPTEPEATAKAVVPQEEAPKSIEPARIVVPRVRKITKPATPPAEVATAPANAELPFKATPVMDPPVQTSAQGQKRKLRYVLEVYEVLD